MNAVSIRKLGGRILLEQHGMFICLDWKPAERLGRALLRKEDIEDSQFRLKQEPDAWVVSWGTAEIRLPLGKFSLSDGTAVDASSYLGTEVIRVAKAVEAEAVVDSTAEDQAILLRAGLPWRLSDDAKVFRESVKRMETLKGNFRTNGITAAERASKVGVPSLIWHPKKVN